MINGLGHYAVNFQRVTCNYEKHGLVKTHLLAVTQRSAS